MDFICFYFPFVSIHWLMVCKDGLINLDSQEHLPGGDVSIAASSALILYRN